MWQRVMLVVHGRPDWPGGPLFLVPKSCLFLGYCLNSRFNVVEERQDRTKRRDANNCISSYRLPASKLTDSSYVDLDNLESLTLRP